MRLKEKLSDENEKREHEKEIFQNEVCVLFKLYTASYFLIWYGTKCCQVFEPEQLISVS